VSDTPTQLRQLSRASLQGQVPASVGAKGGNVASVGWQVTPRDAIWRVSSRSGEAGCQPTNCYTMCHRRRHLRLVHSTRTELTCSASIGHVPQRRDLIGCSETGTVGAQSVRAPLESTCSELQFLCCEQTFMLSDTTHVSVSWHHRCNMSDATHLSFTGYRCRDICCYIFVSLRVCFSATNV